MPLFICFSTGDTSMLCSAPRDQTCPGAALEDAPGHGLWPAQDFCYWCYHTSSNPGKWALAGDTDHWDPSAQSSLATSSTAITLHALAPGIGQESAGLYQMNLSVAAEIWGM